MRKPTVRNWIIAFAAVCSLTLFNGCEQEVEYREVIKEVPVEVPVKVPVKVPVEVPVKVPVEVPVEVPVKVPVEVPVPDEAKVKELTEKIEEHKTEHENQLAILAAMHEMELLAIQESAPDDETLFEELDAMKKAHQEQIEALNELYNAKIAELQSQLRSATDYEIYEFRVYKKSDPDKVFEIPSLNMARGYYMGYIENPDVDVPSDVIRIWNISVLEDEIEASKYISDNAESVINNVTVDKLAYGLYREDEYVYIWFLKSLW